MSPANALVKATNHHFRSSLDVINIKEIQDTLSLLPLASYVHNITLSDFGQVQTVSVDGLHRTGRPMRSTGIETFFASRMTCYGTFQTSFPDYPALNGTISIASRYAQLARARHHGMRAGAGRTPAQQRNSPVKKKKTADASANGLFRLRPPWPRPAGAAAARRWAGPTPCLSSFCW